MQKLRLINETGFPGDWKLLDEEGKNIFEKLFVTNLYLDATSPAKLVLEVPIYPDNINVDAVINAENIGINIIEHRVINHNLAKDKEF